MSLTLLLYHALVEAAANTNSGFFSIQVSGAAAGDADWVEVFRFLCSSATGDTEEMTALEPAAETVLAIASTTGLVTPGQIIYVQDDDTLAQSEWHMIQEYSSNASVTIVDGLKYEKAIADTIWTIAEVFTCTLDLTSVGRVRVIFIHEGAAGANCHVKALAIYGDSIG
ncbi:MAG: hypothetical protein KJ954_13725 [Alphaproteobacteria bacterium]|nr:hypothetical protein [Alphaproteobacteria bacterium]